MWLPLPYILPTFNIFYTHQPHILPPFNLFYTHQVYPLTTDHHGPLVECLEGIRSALPQHDAMATSTKSLITKLQSDACKSRLVSKFAFKGGRDTVIFTVHITFQLCCGELLCCNEDVMKMVGVAVE